MKYTSLWSFENIAHIPCEFPMNHPYCYESAMKIFDTFVLPHENMLN